MSELVAENLGFGYPRFPVGRGVDLRLEPGAVLCLLGPNGCGKTTLFKTLLGILPKQAGEVRLNGTSLPALPPAEVARQISYVPQAHAAVFPYAVHDMVVMGRAAHRGPFSGPSREDHRQASEALATLGIADLEERDYTRLSGGQRQLVLIARALAQAAPLIVMDEPTASLDFGNQVLVLEQVRRLAASGFGIVLSTHDPDHAFACGTEVAVMRDGAVTSSGPPEETLTADLLTEIYGVGVTVEILSDGRRVCVPRLAQEARSGK